MVAYSFNASQFDPQYGGGSQLPPGRYKGCITDTRREPTKGGNGDMLVMDVSVLEGPQKGNIQTDRLNLNNPSAQAVEIANKALAAYCAVIGIGGFNDTVELHNKPFQFEVRYQKGKSPEELPAGPNYTEISALADMAGNPPGKAAAGRQAAPPAAIAIPAAEVKPASPPAAGGGWAQAAPAAQVNGAAPAGGGWAGK